MADRPNWLCAWLNDRSAPVPEKFVDLLDKYGDLIRQGAVSYGDIRRREDVSKRACECLWAMAKAGGDAVAQAASTQAVAGEGGNPRGSYSHDGDGYVFEWTEDGRDRVLMFSEAEWTAIIRDYVGTHMGGAGMSMQEVAVTHGLSRRDFNKVKGIYGLTKDHEPFTIREIESRPVDDIVDESVAMIRRQVRLKVERKSYSAIKLAAARWLDLKDGVLDPLAELLQDVCGMVPVPSSPVAPSTPEGTMWGYQGSDLHYGLLACAEFSIGEQVYNRQIARERWERGLVETIEHGFRITGGEPPDVFNLAVGGDFFHVDNIHGATSSMRHHQDLDGVPDTLLLEGVEAYVAAVEYLLTKVPRIRLDCVPGNHDEMLSRAAFAALWARYKDDPRITFGNAASSHAFLLYGDNAIVWHHGHGESTAASLGGSIDSWLRETGKSARNKIAITGNLHHFDIVEDDNCMLIQQPSPAASDRYHVQNGYDKSRPATLGIYIGARSGLLSTRYIPFDVPDAA